MDATNLSIVVSTLFGMFLVWMTVMIGTNLLLFLRNAKKIKKLKKLLETQKNVSIESYNTSGVPTCVSFGKENSKNERITVWL